MSVEEQPAQTNRKGRVSVISPEVPPRLLSAQAAARYLGVPYTSLRELESPDVVEIR